MNLQTHKIRIYLGPAYFKIFHLLFWLFGIEHQDRAILRVSDHIPDIDSRGYNRWSIEQLKVLNDLKEDLKRYVRNQSVLNIFTPEELAQYYCQRIFKDFTIPFYHSKYFTKFIGTQVEYAVPLPKEVYSVFFGADLNVNPRVSSFFWSLYLLWNFFDGLLQLVRSFVVVSYVYIRKVFTCSLKTLKMPKYFWLGFSPTDFGNGTSDISIFSFIQEKKLPFLEENGLSFVGNPYMNGPDHKVGETLVGRNHFQFAGAVPMSERRLLEFYVESIKLVFSLFKALFTWDQWVLWIAKDIGKLPRAKYWFEVVQPKVIIKPHSANVDELWMLLRNQYGAQLWTVFYSTFCRDIEFIGEEIKANVAHHAVYIADVFAVWNSEQKAWLASFGYTPDKIIPFGPIVFSSYKVKLPTKEQKTKPTIAIFDVAPFDNEMLIKKGRQIFYFVYDTVVMFIEDILDSADEVYGKGNYQAILKPKYSGNVDSRYQHYLEALANVRSDLIIQDVLRSPIQSVAEANIAISIPFTSPSYIAYDLKKPACFFDPTGRVAAQFYTDSHPPLISGKQNLVEWLRSAKL